MLVSHILRLKQQNSVFTIEASATVAEAAAILSTRRIGAVVVSGDGKHPEGILSERDIVRELGRTGPECLARPVAGIMTKALVTCKLSEQTDEVLRKMTEGRFRHIPVMEAGVMIGLISIGDVVKARLEELHADKNALESMIKGY